MYARPASLELFTATMATPATHERRGVLAQRAYIAEHLHLAVGWVDMSLFNDFNISLTIECQLQNSRGLFYLI